MISRKGSIISLANARSLTLLDAIPETRPRAKANLQALWAICQALVQRATPISPTAKVVSEEGRIRSPEFPSVQTIYNEYREFIAIWRRAFHDIRNIDAPDPIAVEELDAIDLTHMDHGPAAIIDVLRRVVKELRKQNDGLREIISSSVPVPADHLDRKADELIDSLGDWLVNVNKRGFEIDTISLKVSRRTPIGTAIMDADLFNELCTFVDDYRRRRKAGSAL